MYNILVRPLYTLASDHPDKSSTRLTPYIVKMKVFKDIHENLKVFTFTVIFRDNKELIMSFLSDLYILGDNKTQYLHSTFTLTCLNVKITS